MTFLLVLTLFSAGIRAVSAETTVVFEYNLSPNWNLVSLPLVPLDASVSGLFPDAISAFGFANGYFEVSELTPCKAYWVNLAEGGSYTVEGSENVSSCSDTMNSGWHLFGAPRGITPVAEIAQDPADILTSVFGFENGYYQADTMNEGAGYWVNLSADGIISPTADAVSSLSPFVTGGDITNALASSRSGDCTTYANNYFSSVTNILDGNSYEGDVTISVSGGKCIFASNAIPNHDMGQDADFKSTVLAQDVTYEIAASPAKALSPTYNIWKASVVLLNGGIVDILPAACYDEGNMPLGDEMIGCGPDLLEHPWRYDPMSPLNDFGTDIHNAHVQPDGTYHYHANPMAIFNSDCPTASSASPVIGFAADGFPVYGSCIDDNGSIRSAQSSYQLKAGARQAVSGYTTPAAGTGNIASANYDGQFRGDYEYVAGSGDLDACNGMTVDGQYGYYITNAYPWVLACYSGTPDTSFNPTPTGRPRAP